ncbi:MAG: hypothetical protein K6G88_10805 [Lachnospiraceae bacterium]|nr:hypothetical protein [Lachnospiraceae bacterium]
MNFVNIDDFLDEEFVDRKETVILNSERGEFVFNTDNYRNFIHNLLENHFKGKNTKLKKIDCRIAISKALLGIEEGGDKAIRRYHNRIIRGKTPDRNTTSSDANCILFLEKVNEKAGIKLLVRKNDQDFNADKYISMLVGQLISSMESSKGYYYIGSKDEEFKCFQNNYEMIENNIGILYKTNADKYSKWMGIIKPLKNIIINGDIPGIENDNSTSEEQVWIKIKPELRFFDPVYDIASDDCALYLAYKDKSIFKFKIGEDEKEVNGEIAKRNKYFQAKLKELNAGDKMTTELFQKIFYEEFKDTYKKIMQMFDIVVSF